jgi:hypothetical protein
MPKRMPPPRGRLIITRSAAGSSPARSPAQLIRCEPRETTNRRSAVPASGGPGEAKADYRGIRLRSSTRRRSNATGAMMAPTESIAASATRKNNTVLSSDIETRTVRSTVPCRALWAASRAMVRDSEKKLPCQRPCHTSWCAAALSRGEGGVREWALCHLRSSQGRLAGQGAGPQSRVGGRT